MAVTFTRSARLVCTSSIRLMRSTFDSALKFFKSDNRCGRGLAMHQQSAVDILIQITMRMGTLPYLYWRPLKNSDSRGFGIDAYGENNIGANGQ